MRELYIFFDACQSESPPHREEHNAFVVHTGRETFFECLSYIPAVRSHCWFCRILVTGCVLEAITPVTLTHAACPDVCPTQPLLAP
jgi:hypothetical protein